MADPRIHITFAEPEGDSPLIEAIEGIITEWFGAQYNLVADDIEDCAGNIVEMLHWWSTEEKEEIFSAHTQTPHQDIH